LIQQPGVQFLRLHYQPSRLRMSSQRLDLFSSFAPRYLGQQRSEKVGSAAIIGSERQKPSPKRRQSDMPSPNRTSTIHG
jgi:hypothetical protein